MAKRRRKTRTHLKGPQNAPQSTAPKSFVIRSGSVSRSLAALVQDVRRVMEPNTASRLRERKSNKLRDFLTMCGPIGVSHLLLFSQKGARDVSRTGAVESTEDKNGNKKTKQQQEQQQQRRLAERQRRSQEAIGNINLRIARTPRGPTVTFRVNKFALARDVARAQRRSRAPGGEYQTAPLLVLNNFGSAEQHVKLLVTVFQGLFPPIHVQTMHLSEARRIVLLNYNAETQTIDYRHYLISVRPVGVSRRVRRVIEGSSSLSRGGSKRIPNLASASDISDYLMGKRAAEEQDDENGSMGGFETDASSASEADSDVDDDGKPRSHVQLPSGYVGRGNVRDSQRAVRLRELGPRMELRCVKIEEGIPGAGKDGKSASGGNEVLWHAYVRKSNAEANKQRKDVQQREAERKRRKAEQEANVARKQAEKDARKTKNKPKTTSNAEEEADGEGQGEGEGEEAGEEEEDDEFAYEDMHAEENDDQDDLFEDEDDIIDEEDSVGDVSDAEEEDDDSDLSPIEAGPGDFDSDADDDDDDGKEYSRPAKLKRPAVNTKRNGRART